jgi:hypothetical protein
VGGSDLLGKPRTVGARVDMGAYEWPGPALRLDSMMPDNCYAGAKPVLEVAGSGLDRGCYLYFHGVPHATTWRSEYLVTAVLTSEETQAPGNYEVYVVNPGGETSGRLTFAVTRPVLQTLSLSPLTVTGGNLAAGTLKLTGLAPAGGVTITAGVLGRTLTVIP